MSLICGGVLAVSLKLRLGLPYLIHGGRHDCEYKICQAESATIEGELVEF